ncbi:hypothetical protein CEQ36_18090 [Yersinia intermedia]|nr:hypothetical protein A6J67_05345 [Yersinia sp. FDAARGOS_228]AVL37310.1 hypothetical protein CEQ36_18090 [Yersinia intermedia]
MPQAPKSKKIIFWFKCRLKQQCGAFTSIRQSIYPKLLELQVGSQQTHPDESIYFKVNGQSVIWVSECS